MKDSNDVDELYKWINGRYEEHIAGEITEQEYLDDLEYYKGRLAELESESSDEPEIEDKDPQKPKRVRSTSIAGLRKKLMEEMRD